MGMWPLIYVSLKAEKSQHSHCKGKIFFRNQCNSLMVSASVCKGRLSLKALKDIKFPWSKRMIHWLKDKTEKMDWVAQLEKSAHQWSPVQFLSSTHDTVKGLHTVVISVWSNSVKEILNDAQGSMTHHKLRSRNGNYC